MTTTTRRSRLLAVTLFIGLAGCGFNGCEGGTGDDMGARCRNWTDSRGMCDPGLYCDEHGTCQVCGADGEHCCTHALTFPTCNDGLLCDRSTCTSDCGHEGQRACEGPGTTFFCADGLSYDASMICGAMADSECRGSYVIGFWLQAPEGCATSNPVILSISGESAADECARQWANDNGFALWEPRFEAPETYYYCQYQPPPIDCRPDIGTHDGEVRAYSADDAQRCLQTDICTNCSYVVHEDDAEECPIRDCG